MNGRYLRHAIATAARVARFDTDAMADFDFSFEGFFRSFFAAIVALPLYAIIVMGERRLSFDLAHAAPGSAFVPLPPPDLVYAAIHAGAYVADWLALPLVMIAIVPMLGASKNYVPYIVAYNWGTCIVTAATIVPYTAYLLGLVSFAGVFILYYAVSVFVLVYRWRLARDGLRIPGFTAAGIVILDTLIGILIMFAAARLQGSLA